MPSGRRAGGAVEVRAGRPDQRPQAIITWAVRVWACSCLTAFSCARDEAAKTPAPPPLPRREATAGERALSLLPAGANVVIEADLVRIRTNEVVGPAAQAWLGVKAPSLPGGVETPPLARVDWLVIAAYGVGTPDAASVTLAAAASPPERSVQIADGVYALAPPEWIARVQGAVAEAGPTLRSEEDFLRLRARAMPELASGAALRITARLDDAARIALSREVGVDPAPAAVSVWLDVADDAALVLWADGEDPGETNANRAGKTLAHGLATGAKKLTALPAIRALGLGEALGAARVSPHGSWARFVAVLPPAAFRRLATRIPSQPFAQASQAGEGRGTLGP